MTLRSVGLAGVVPGSGVVLFFGRGDFPREVNVLAVIAFVVILTTLKETNGTELT